MAYLIYCSFEAGGFPYIFSRLLNRHGVETYYVSTGTQRTHDSAVFHFGERRDSWNLSGLLSPSACHSRSFERLIERYDIRRCFATGTGLNALEATRLPYMYWSYGADIDHECAWIDPSSRPVTPRQWLSYVAHVARVPGARSAVLGADAVFIAPYQRQHMARLCPGKKLFFVPQVVPVAPWEALLARRTAARAKLCGELGARYLFFSSTRHHWGAAAANSVDRKGNDVAIRAFARFERAHRGSSKLVLVDKGPAVQASKTLIAELGLQGSIVWIGQMKRDALADYYAAAHACLAQFGTPVLSYAPIESMAAGTPTASFAGVVNDPIVPSYRSSPELCNSLDPDEIAAFMEDCLDPEFALERGRRAWEWVAANCSEATFVEEFKAYMGTAPR